jgi:hypothetical protein
VRRPFNTLGNLHRLPVFFPYSDTSYPNKILAAISQLHIDNISYSDIYYLN